MKVYQNTDIFRIQYSGDGSTISRTDNIVNFSRISLAVGLNTRKGYIHEVEFFMPELSKPMDDIQFPMDHEFREGITFEGQVSSYSMRYELSRTLANRAKALRFDLGLGVNPYYMHWEYEPKVETSYRSSTKLYGFSLNVIPRIKYNFSQRFGIDLNVPLKIYDLRKERKHIENPNIPVANQTFHDGYSTFFESAYTARLGLMYTWR